MLIYPAIENLLTYAQSHLLLDELDVIWARNLILNKMKLSDYTQYEVDVDAIDALDRPDSIIEPIVAYAIDNGIITADDKENFVAEIMNILCKRPAEITDIFYDLHAKNPVKAFDWLYDYGIKSDYIHYTKICNNQHWEAKGTKGKIEITINTSKPEKSLTQVKAEASKKAGNYPACNICKENEGFSNGNQVRQTLRTVPITLGGEEWFWQFSPYAYFNHHGIAVNNEHVPMVVNEKTLTKLFDFVDFMPNYFIGCNASLPGIGGSILSHDHFQGGGKLLPMHKAGDKYKLKSEEYPYIDCSVVDWYNSVIRLSSTNKAKLIELGTKILNAWASYSDETVGVIANSDGAQHNGITPIVRKANDGKYVLEIILRNNLTTSEHPEGVFHAHKEYHNIKSESIGLIEAMGLFILPGRLDRELDQIEKYLSKQDKYSATTLPNDMRIHQNMIEKLIKEAGSAKLSPLEARLNIKDEVNRVCECILDNTAVFKKDETGETAFEKFLNTVGFIIKR